MKTIKLSLFFILCVISSCTDKSTNLNQINLPSFSFKTSKCISGTIAKESRVQSDSFSYSFSQYLTLNFSVPGNCCPDSNRFMVSNEIRSDTIFITVTDTAQNLCRCSCVYMIHTQLTDLQKDSYTVRCRLGKEDNYIDPLYLVNVVRGK